MPNIIDISNCLKNKNINKNEMFALDTNVMIWTFYSKASLTPSYQTTIYPNFISYLINSGNDLYVTAINLNEMFHFIEINEFDIYKASLNPGNRIGKKAFRAIKSERLKLKNEITLIYQQLEAIKNIKIIGSTLELDKLNEFLSKYDIHNCDYFDYFLIDYCNKNNLSIITDDIDFDNCCSTTNLYSANPKLIKRAVVI